MARTATFSWELVPENADPAWWLFDRLVCTVDGELGTQRDRLLHARVAHQWSSAVSSTSLRFMGGGMEAVSYHPRGPVGGIVTVPGSMMLQCEVRFGMAPNALLTAGRFSVALISLVDMSAVVITGNSFWGCGTLLNPVAPFAGTVVVPSFMPGNALWGLLAGAIAAGDSGDTLLGHAPMTPQVCWYAYPRVTE